MLIKNKKYVQLMAAWPIVFWAHSGAVHADEAVKKNYESYLIDTSLPTVPAATLLGVDNTKIIEVSSVSKLNSTLTAAKSASSSGVPFGIDVSPATLFADQGGWLAQSLKKTNYASDTQTRLMFRTRLSFATVTQDNSKQSAWGISTRLLDFRDPFVDPGLEKCYQPLDKMLENQKFKETKLSKVEPSMTPEYLTFLHNFRNVLADFYPPDLRKYKEIDLAAEKEIEKVGVPPNPAAPFIIDSNTLLVSSTMDEITKISKESIAPKESALTDAIDKYNKCAALARTELANRSYVALGYTEGNADAVDNALPYAKPGKSFWLTFVYGFEGLDALLAGEKKWHDLGQPPTDSKSRLMFHIADNQDASKIVTATEQDVNSRVYGIGYSYASGDHSRLSAQGSKSTLEQGSNKKTEKNLVLGLDFKVQDSVWLGLSWGRKSIKDQDTDNEVAAQLKWGFSDSSWLK